MKKSLMRKYAALLVKSGVNIQKGQDLCIHAEPENYEFVTMLVEEGYRAGARTVEVEWKHSPLTKLHYRHQSLKSLCEFPKWKEEQWKELSEKLPAMIHVLSDDPDGLKGINQDKMQKVGRARYKIIKPYRDAMDNKHQWLVASVPGKAWAKKVFPQEKRTSTAVEKLWNAIFETVLINENDDAVEAWKKKDELLSDKCKKLNNYNFDYLHYKSANGTDFTCSLLPESRWCGGGEETLAGVFFNANMPTEEVFTTPKKGACEGRLVASMPLSHNGSLIEGFYIDFKDGKAVSWHADKGEDVLTNIITTDEGSCMIGELALVPQDSAICKQNILYYNTLFDENASCHVALGEGYTACIEGFADMSFEQIHELGVNDSQMHVDFMIGTSDMEITGYKNGKPSTIFKNGNWAI